MKNLRHYEIVLLIHPDQSDQVPAMVERYTNMIKQSGGSIDRQEDWGRRQLEYPINKLPKAHYLLFNISCSKEMLEELEQNFRYNDSVIRNFTLKRDVIITKASLMMQKSDDASDSASAAGDRDNSASGARYKKQAQIETTQENEVDYKDLTLLRSHIMESGRIVPSRISRTKAGRQRQIAAAIKIDRFLALLPYCDRH